MAFARFMKPRFRDAALAPLLLPLVPLLAPELLPLVPLLLAPELLPLVPLELAPIRFNSD